MRYGTLILGGVVLAASLGYTLLHTPTQRPGKGRHLAAAIPIDPSGWTSHEVPLGATEEVRGAVAETLRYADVLLREYRSARGTLTVYIAYWAPGQMPTQLVASHTPDRCWTEVGWVCEQLRHKTRLTLPAGVTLPGEWRLFADPGGQRLQVLYWHLAGGQVYDQGERLATSPSLGRWLRDALGQVLQAPPEQYFIRLSSDRPFEELQDDAGWRQLTQALGGLGLQERVKP